jgi:uncharacterized membrane protein YidH (DUF202 family)
MAEQTTHSTPPLDRSTELAFERTRIAYERTMMAWIRTETSLITFGFSIYKLFQLEGLGIHSRVSSSDRGFRVHAGEHRTHIIASGED